MLRLRWPDDLRKRRLFCSCGPVAGRLTVTRSHEGSTSDHRSHPGPRARPQTEDDLAIGTAVSPVGVHCVALCGSCAEAGKVPNLGWSGVTMLVMEHCSHLDIDLDEMAAALAAERVEAAPR